MNKTLLSALAFAAIAAFSVPSLAATKSKAPVAAHVVKAPGKVVARHPGARPGFAAKRGPAHVDPRAHNVRARDTHDRDQRLARERQLRDDRLHHRDPRFDR